MKFNKQNKIILIIIAAIISFNLGKIPLFFVQDDWYHLYQIQNKSFFQVLSFFNLFQNGKIDPLNFYRPLSTKLFFYLSYQIFKLQPLFFRLINIIFFSLNLILFKKIINKILAKTSQVETMFFYSFNLAHFTLFSYITKAEDLLFGVFSLATILSSIKNNKKLALIFFIAALASRESAIMVPFGLLLINYFIKKDSIYKYLKKDKGVFFVLAIYLLSRTFVYGWPKDRMVYSVSLVGSHIISNLLKYLQWNLNITGLIKQSNLLAYISLAVLAVLIAIILKALFKIRKEKINLRIIIFGLLWWLLFLFPVIFFPSHRDPWNLIISSGGLAIVLSQLINLLKKSLKVIYLSSYLIVFLLGLNFYNKSHWTVKRAELVKNSFNNILNQCQKDDVVIKAESETQLKEIEYSWYYQLGPRVLCKNHQLKVFYEQEK